MAYRFISGTRGPHQRGVVRGWVDEVTIIAVLLDEDGQPLLDEDGELLLSERETVQASSTVIG
jgi:hypothetical protein